MRNNSVAKLLGGLGEKKSNGGTQYFQQDRVYDGRCDIALCVPANLPGGSYRYLFEVSNETSNSSNER